MRILLAILLVVLCQVTSIAQFQKLPLEMIEKGEPDQIPVIRNDSLLSYISPDSLNIILGSNNLATGSIKTVGQSSHGFSVLQPISSVAGTYVAADTSNFAVGVITEVISPDSFHYATNGVFTVTTHGKDVDSTYYTPNTAGQAVKFSSLTQYAQILYQPLDTGTVYINVDNYLENLDATAGITGTFIISAIDGEIGTGWKLSGSGGSGLTSYSVDSTYIQDQIVQDNGVLYTSQQNGNTGHGLTDPSWWKETQQEVPYLNPDSVIVQTGANFLEMRINGVLPYITGSGEIRFGQDIAPFGDGGAALGSSTRHWSDLYAYNEFDIIQSQGTNNSMSIQPGRTRDDLFESNLEIRSDNIVYNPTTNFGSYLGIENTANTRFFTIGAGGRTIIGEHNNRSTDYYLEVLGTSYFDSLLLANQGIDVNSNKIINVSDGTADTDAINLGQIEDFRWRDWHPILYNGIDSIIVDTITHGYPIGRGLNGDTLTSVDYITNLAVGADYSVRILYYDVSAGTYTNLATTTHGSTDYITKQESLTQIVNEGDWLYLEIISKSTSDTTPNGMAVKLKFMQGNLWYMTLMLFMMFSSLLSAQLPGPLNTFPKNLIDSQNADSIEFNNLNIVDGGATVQAELARVGRRVDTIATRRIDKNSTSNEQFSYFYFEGDSVFHVTNKLGSLEIDSTETATISNAVVIVHSETVLIDTTGKTLTNTGETSYLDIGADKQLSFTNNTGIKLSEIWVTTFYTKGGDLILDYAPDAIIAVGMFQMNSSYTGPLLEGHRKSDDITFDVQPDAFGRVSEASMIVNRSDAGSSVTLGTISASDTIIVSKWYDQSGNSNDYSFTNEDQGFALAVDGVVGRDSLGNPAMYQIQPDTSSSLSGQSLGFFKKELSDTVELGQVTTMTMWQPKYYPDAVAVPGGTAGVTGYDFAGWKFHEDGPTGADLNGWIYYGFNVDGQNVRVDFEYGDGTNASTGNVGLPHLLDSPQNYVIRVKSDSLFARVYLDSVATQLTTDFDTIKTPWLNIFNANRALSNPNSGLSNGFVLWNRFIDNDSISQIETLLNDSYYYDTTEVSPQFSSLLPQYLPHQRTLYAYLETFDTTDFQFTNIDSNTVITYTPTESTKGELFLYDELDAEIPNASIFQFPSEQFVLDDGNGGGFEGDGNTVRIAVRNSSSYKGSLDEGAWYVECCDLPGINNPFKNSIVLKRRLFTQAVADMLFHEGDLMYYQRFGSFYSDATGMHLFHSMRAYDVSKDIVNIAVRHAFLRTCINVMKMHNAFKGPRDVTSNMDTKTHYGLALLYKAAKEEGLNDIAGSALSISKTQLLGKNKTVATAQGRTTRVLFHPAGYIGEGNAPEVSYNGISLYYITKAAAVVKDYPEWNFLHGPDGILDRMVKFQVHQVYREPDGRFRGHSGYSTRTAHDHANLQWQFGGSQMLTAMTNDRFISMYFKNLNNQLQDNEFTFFDTLSVSELQSRISTSFPIGGNGLFLEGSTLYNSTGANWSGSFNSLWWAQFNSTQQISYPDTSFYSRIENYILTNSDTLKLPNEKSDTHNVPFLDADNIPEFWSYKDIDSLGNHQFSFFIECFNLDFDHNAPSHAFRGGGSLQTFWTDSCGIVLNARQNKPDDPGNALYPYNRWDSVAIWATHHMWGETSDDLFFSSAQRNTFQTNFTWDDVNSPTQVVCTNTPDREDESNWSGTVTYTRTFDAVTNGLRVTTLFTSNEVDSLDSLWESVPVKIKNASPDNIVTSFSYWNGSAWVSFSIPETTVNTQYVRIEKAYDGGNTHYVYLSFDGAYDVQLYREWVNNYQSNLTCQQLMVDMHPNTGNSETIASSSVIYTIQTVSPI